MQPENVQAAEIDVFASEELDPPLFPHPQNAATMVCVACKIILKQKSSFAKHALTKMHREAVAKRARML